MEVDTFDMQDVPEFWPYPAYEPAPPAFSPASSACRLSVPERQTLPLEEILGAPAPHLSAAGHPGRHGDNGWFGLLACGLFEVYYGRHPAGAFDCYRSENLCCETPAEHLGGEESSRWEKPFLDNSSMNKGTNSQPKQTSWENAVKMKTHTEK